jgi:N-acyl-D-aspartate/D-glutamate deacylase
MTYDLVIRGGQVCDGTGAPSFVADVAVRDGRIVAIGDVDPSDADKVIEADGLWVTPGFIDIHTHYDAQLHFEPTASPSSWHGTTTVFIGNCGFTFAPAKPDDLPWLLQMLSRVEGMSPEALREAVTFPGGSFADYLGGFEGQIGVNVGANVGHCALRRFVMGDAASERTATEAEIAQMQELLREALAEGAIGFTSSQLELHQAHDGRPVPSNLADPDELVALASVLAEFDFGSIEFIPKTFLEGYSAQDRDLIVRLWRASGKPIHLNTLTLLPQAPDGWKRSLEFATEALAQEGAHIHPMFASNHQGVHFALGSTFLFDEYLTLRSALTSPPADRDAILRSPDFRAALRVELADVTNKSFTFNPQILRVEVVHDPAHERYVGMTIAEMAEDMGRDPLDAFLDVSLAEELRTQFVQAARPDKRRLDAIEELIRSGIISAGASDAGAHLLSFCGVDYTTRLLTEWVPHVLSFEQAVSRLTMVPAQLHGLDDRGVIKVGAAADLNVIDRTRLATTPPRYVTDFPADSGRFVIDAEGYVATVVNGTIMMEEGTHTGALPGHVLRGAGTPAPA